jgi:hypothetical protein
MSRTRSLGVAGPVDDEAAELTSKLVARKEGVMFAGRAGRPIALALVLATWSCSRLPQRAEPGSPGSVRSEVLPDSISVPAAWGNLISVTINPAFTNVAQLWFQDAQGNVRVVVFDVYKQRLRRASLIGRH